VVARRPESLVRLRELAIQAKLRSTIQRLGRRTTIDDSEPRPQAVHFRLKRASSRPASCLLVDGEPEAFAGDSVELPQSGLECAPRSMCSVVSLLT
jgi:hypothetical protein